MDLHYSLAGGLVGFLIGLTGVGGGALMTPLLILLFGLSPAVAVGTDLWFAAITKSIGGVMHRKFGSPDWSIIKLLAAGSLPAAVLTLLWLGLIHGGRLDSHILMRLLGAALLLTALIMPMKDRLVRPLVKFRRQVRPRFGKQQRAATVVAGALVGVLVCLTSVGAGALVAVTLLFLYPIRLDARSLVGTDIIHAVPLALVAAIGHSWFGNVDLKLLLALLIGSVPGIVAGSLLSSRTDERIVRAALAVMLAVSAVKLLIA